MLYTEQKNLKEYSSHFCRYEDEILLKLLEAWLPAYSKKNAVDGSNVRWKYDIKNFTSGEKNPDINKVGKKMGISFIQFGIVTELDTVGKV